jgi:hypothetical protein
MPTACPCGKSKRPSFGLPGGKPHTAKWCSKCPEKPTEAVDVRNKRCACGRSYPSYGLPGGNTSTAKWCLKCPSKPDNVVKVHSKKCECKMAQPSLGLPGDLSARWCAKCPGMPLNVVKMARKRQRRTEQTVAEAAQTSADDTTLSLISSSASLEAGAKAEDDAALAVPSLLPQNADSIASSLSSLQGQAVS